MKNRNVNTNASVASSPGPHLQTFRGPPSSMEISRRVDSPKTLFAKLKPRSLSAFLLKNRNDSVPARFVIHSPSNSLFFLVHQTVRNDTLHCGANTLALQRSPMGTGVMRRLARA